MAKKVTRVAKLQFMAGQAKPGPELAGLGIDMGGFTKQYNNDTKDRQGEIVPVVITAYNDRTFDFVLKTTPASFLLKKAAGIKTASSNQAESCATISQDEVRKIAEYKMVDLNANDIDAAIKTIEGTARNMGIIVEGMTPKKEIKIVKQLKPIEEPKVEESTKEDKDDK